MNSLNKALEAIRNPALDDQELSVVIAEICCNMNPRFQDDIILELLICRPELGNNIGAQLEIFNSLKTSVENAGIPDDDLKDAYIKYSPYLAQPFRSKLLSRLDTYRSKISQELQVETDFVRELAVSQEMLERGN